jgi:TetR/AcrR family transcriptional repressor of nem operon
MTLRERIVHEALRQFSAKGFLNTSITDILNAVGSSKGGLYNHFNSKEALFKATLSEARKIWRERNLDGIDPEASAVDQLKRVLANYRDRYLTDSQTFPGGCIFVNLAVELSDQQPRLAEEVNDGFVRFKSWMKRLLDREHREGRLVEDVSTAQVTTLLFAGLLGACVMYATDKSRENLDLTIGALIDHLDRIRR